MNNSEIKWYSMNLDQKVEEHEPIDLKRALEIADQYLDRGRGKFESAEEAIAATMFGFSKSKSEFIEICINGPKRISYKIECSNPNASWFQKLRGGTIRHEDELHSRDKLIHKITEFFSYPSEYFIQQYKDSTNHSGRSPLGFRPGASLGIRIFTIVFFSFLAAVFAYVDLHGISSGKISYSRRGHEFWIYQDSNPKAFWICIIFYSAILVWLIRGCILELKIVKKILQERREQKS
jgi:hypothetical protein